MEPHERIVKHRVDFLKCFIFTQVPPATFITRQAGQQSTMCTQWRISNTHTLQNSEVRDSILLPLQYSTISRKIGWVSFFPLANKRFFFV